MNENIVYVAHGKLLTDTKEAFANVRSSVVVAMQKLYQVREELAWREKAETWGEYVESELSISQSFASKLLTVNQHYLVEAGISPDKLAGIDYECLYLAASTEGSYEEQIAKAANLTRRELREERNEEQPHEHLPITICKTCSLRL